MQFEASLLRVLGALFLAGGVVSLFYGAGYGGVSASPWLAANLGAILYVGGTLQGILLDKLNGSGRD